jgi:hypothetical protein
MLSKKHLLGVLIAFISMPCLANASPIIQQVMHILLTTPANQQTTA